LLAEFFGDVAVGDRAEQTTVDAGLLGQLDGRAAELLALGLRFSQLGGRSLFEFGALGLLAAVARRARPDGIRKLRA
jgi:hypothetical protein